MRIAAYDFNFEREKLMRPFKFKGGAFTEKWINAVALESAAGGKVVGIGSTAILWSDPDVFTDNSELDGNLLMSKVAERYCQLLVGYDFDSPAQAVQQLFPSLHQYAMETTGKNSLRKTFTLNSMIATDNAVWKLWFMENNCNSFDDIIPVECRKAFSARQQRIACLPLITYNVEAHEILKYVDDGIFFLKIKIGQPGTQNEMLELDCQRLKEIFELTRDKDMPYTECGKVVYYLDANGRYESKELLVRLLAYADSIDMLERILLLEEPFPEDLKIDVSDLPVRISADESLHGVDDVHERIDLGYGAMTLKPAGKTLSMSLLMGNAAFERQVPCYVADSACVPLLVDWNKNVAARLPVLPGLKIGFMEANGSAFYGRWHELMAEHPCAGAGWLYPVNGVFELDETFFQQSGGIFSSPGHYADLVKI